MTKPQKRGPGRPPGGGRARTPVSTMSIRNENMQELRECLQEREDAGRASWTIRGFIQAAIREKIAAERARD